MTAPELFDTIKLIAKNENKSHILSYFPNYFNKFHSKISI